jgi:hypothetical protein
VSGNTFESSIWLLGCCFADWLPLIQLLRVRQAAAELSSPCLATPRAARAT